MADADNLTTTTTVATNAKVTATRSTTYSDDSDTREAIYFASVFADGAGGMYEGGRNVVTRTDA